MGLPSLQQVMNEMAQQGIGAVMSPSVMSQPITELEAFILLDPLLAELNKNYLDAKNYRHALQKQFGKDNAMVEVAMDMEDSAWCAMQTRYLELREQPNMMRLVQKKMRECEQKFLEQKRLEEEKERKRFGEWLPVYARMREMQKLNASLEWLFILILFGMTPFEKLRCYQQIRKFA